MWHRDDLTSGVQKVENQVDTLYNNNFEWYGLVCRELILFLEKMVKNETIHLNLYQSITITDPAGNDTFTNVLTWMVQYKFC